MMEVVCRQSEVNNLHEETQRRLVSRTVTDYLFYFPALAVSGLMGLVTVAVLSKFFSPADYGHYTLAFSTLLLLSMVTGLWLRASVLRLLPQYTASNQVNEFLGTLLGAGTFFTVAVVLLYALTLPLLKPSLDDQLYRLLWLLVPGVPILTIFIVLQESHRIQGRSALYSSLILLRVLGGFLIGLFLAVTLSWGPVGMLLGLIAVVAGAIGGHLVLAGRRLARKTQALRWSGSVLRDMLAYTLPIVGLNLAGTILAVSDRYLIEAYLGSYDLGIYAVSYGIAEGGMRLVANTFRIATEPTIFNSWVTNGPQATFRFIERLFRYYLILALPALIGLSLLRHEIVTLFATPEYAGGSLVVIYVSLALFLHGYSLIVGTVFDATKRTMIPFVTFLIAGLFNVMLNLLLLPRFGYLAAAWSTCASYGVLLGLNVIAARRIVHLRIVGGYLWKIGLASAGMGAFVLAVQHWLPPSIPGLAVTTILAATVYMFLVLATGGVLPEEKHTLKARLKGIFVRFRRLAFVRNG
jgi:O-antigen/teichoic acid export membrane protein